MGISTNPGWMNSGLSEQVWLEARLSRCCIFDVRALRAQSMLSWNGQETEFLPSTKGFAEASQGLHSPATISDQQSSFKFSFPLSLNGSEAVYVVSCPRGRNRSSREQSLCGIALIGSNSGTRTKFATHIR
jgi:inner membrane protein involved in colicin E2 resistance